MATLPCSGRSSGGDSMNRSSQQIGSRTLPAKIFRGTLKQMRSANAKVSAANAAARKQRRSMHHKAAQAVGASIPSMSSLASEANSDYLVPPGWARDLHSSHTLYHAGGVVFCSRCARVGTMLREHLLFKECRGTYPDGSRGRLRRLMKGEALSLWEHWPDGQPARLVRPVASLRLPPDKLQPAYRQPAARAASRFPPPALEAAP